MSKDIHLNLISARLLLLILVVLVVPITILFIKSGLFNQGPVCKNCNVILITLDVMGSNHLPCYGYERNTAPNLCKFATENVYFTNSHSHSSLTLQSTYSLFSSLYPHTHKINFPFAENVLSSKYKTFTEMLQSNGYDTVYLGPAKDPNTPLNRGLERGFNLIQEAYLPHEWEKNFQRFFNNLKKNKPTFLYIQNSYVHAPYYVGKKDTFKFTTDNFDFIPTTEEEYIKFTPELLTFILNSLEKRISQSSTKESKELNTKMHSAFKNAKTLEEAKNIFFRLPLYETSEFLFTFNYLKRLDLSNEEQVKFLNALYDETIYILDEKIKPLLELFKDKKIADNTIVIITSQHGEAFMEHGEFGHGETIYGETTSVPLIMSIPNIKSLQVDNLIQTVDIYPTLLSLLQIKVPSFLEGKDLSPLLSGSSKNTLYNRYVFSELDRRDIGYDARSIRDTRWSFYALTRVNKYRDFELYDLFIDPKEQKNIAKDKPELTTFYLKELNNWLKGDAEFTKDKLNFPAWIDEEKRKKLIKDGYF